VLDIFGNVEPSCTAYQEMLHYKDASWQRDDLFWDRSLGCQLATDAELVPKIALTTFGSTLCRIL
jgi:hypothetical protein